MPDSTKISEALLSEGAAAVGITPAIPIENFAERVGRLHAKGALGGMQWLARTAERRANPADLLPDAKSIICSAWPYPSVQESPFIARYRCQIDYHIYIRERLERAWQKCSFKNSRFKFAIDSSPIAEKRYAERAGLGWIGKNTLVINPKFGSFFCLGLIITDLEVHVCHPAPAFAGVNSSGDDIAIGDNVPTKNRCGNCTRCIDACPTKALAGPYRLIPNRCISYLTTEHKGDIPEKLRPLIGEKIFGCDTCQEVCPFNKKVPPKTGIPPAKFSPKDVRALNELITIDDSDFHRLFDRTPIGRIGRARLLRNVAVALGNIGDRSSTPFLSRSLQDKESLIRVHAKWAIEQMVSDTTL